MKNIYTGFNVTHQSFVHLGVFSKHAPKIIENLIQENLFSIWSSTMNFCVVDNDFGFFVPADSGVYQIATACQAGCVPVNEFEMGIIMTQLYFVTILKSCLPNSAQAAIIDNKFNCIHAYAKETFCDVVFELYESLVAVYKKD